MRLDKYLSELNIGSRSQIKTYIRQKLVTVNGEVAQKPEQKVNENSDIITFRGKKLKFQKFVYYMLYKPQGVVSATQDNTADTVIDLIASHGRTDLFPVGRLDKDTEGLLLITNDGELAHNMLSPKKHVDKTYLVTIKRALLATEITALENGVDIGDDKLTAPAMVEIQDDTHILLTIHEGRFHQVKRMLKAVENEVLALKRISFGALSLDEKLSPGESRELTEQEITLIKGYNSMQDKQFMIKDKEAVIFDLDGSLVDSMWMWREIDIEYLGRFGIPLPKDLQSNIEGMSFSETAVYFKNHFEIPDSIEQMKNDWNQMAWDKYMHEVPLKPGIPEFLKGCRESGIKLGIATSNSRELVENIAAVHNLKDYFACIMTGCEVAHGKPAPDIYLAVADQLQVDPAKCLVFEDIVPGIMAGKNAGMEVCAVEDAYSVHDREAKADAADYYIEDYYGFFA